MKRIYSRVVVFSFAAGFGLLCLTAFTTKSKPVQLETAKPATRKPHKYLGKDMSFPSEPIEIAELKVKGRPVSVNSKVFTTDDWLDGLYIRIKNISGRSIQAVTLYLTFPELPPRPLSLPLTWTRGEQAQTSASSELLEPGESAVFSVEGQRYEQLKTLLETRAPLSEVQRLNIEFQSDCI